MMDKCSKKDCVDFDIPQDELDMGVGACINCKSNRQNPQWPSDRDQYLKVDKLVDPTVDVPVSDAYPAFPWIGKDDELSEVAYDTLAKSNLATGWSPNAEQLNVGWRPNAAQTALLKLESKDVLLKKHDPKYGTISAGKTGHTIREDLKHNEIDQEDIKDSGSRTEFETGAVRDVQGNKGRFDLLPKMTLWALAKHYEKGCQKYGDRNWEKGIPIKNYIDSGIRHLTEFELGLQDENHLIAALWNIACAYETLLRIDMGILPKSLDTLPYPLRSTAIKDSEQVLAWERMRHPLHEATLGSFKDV